jgi:ribosomal 50S subunit-associated protein YjgA (DUF615 family)
MDDQNTDTPESDATDATMLLRIEEMIRTHISQIDDLIAKITEHKDMIDDVFKNSETFQEHDKIAKEATRIRSKTKQEIMKQPQVAELAAKLKEMKNEKTELQEGLSDYLREYQRISGSNEIEGEDGEVREIVYVAKLVRKSKFRP